MRNYLDQELLQLLDLSTLEIKKDTFVDQELVEHFSDILYQLKSRNGQDIERPKLAQLLEQLTTLYQNLFASAPKALPAIGKMTHIAYYNRGLTYLQLARYNEALNDYGRAIQINPEDAVAYVNRGLTYASLARYNEALNDYGRAIQLNPSYADAYFKGHCIIIVGRSVRHYLTLRRQHSFVSRRHHKSFRVLGESLAWQHKKIRLSRRSRRFSVRVRSMR